MSAFLQSIGYNSWVLPALLAIPVIGALLVWLHGATLKGATGEAGRCSNVKDLGDRSASSSRGAMTESAGCMSPSSG